MDGCVNLSERHSETGLPLADQNLLVSPSTQRQIRQERRQDQQRAKDQKETVGVLIQPDTTYIHAEQTCHQVNRQGRTVTNVNTNDVRLIC